MKLLSFRKILLAVTLTVVIITAPFERAQALIPVVDVPGRILSGFQLASDYLCNLALGTPGVGGGTVAALKAAKSPCKVAKKAYEISNTADAFPGADVIAGSAGQIAKLQSKIVALTVVKNCYELVLEADEDAAIGLAEAAGIKGLTAIATNNDQVQSAIDTMDLRLDRLKELR